MEKGRDLRGLAYVLMPKRKILRLLAPCSFLGFICTCLVPFSSGRKEECNTYWLPKSQKMIELRDQPSVAFFFLKACTNSSSYKHLIRANGCRTGNGQLVPQGLNLLSSVIWAPHPPKKTSFTRNLVCFLRILEGNEQLKYVMKEKSLLKRRRKKLKIYLPIYFV